MTLLAHFDRAWNRTVLVAKGVGPTRGMVDLGNRGALMTPTDHARLKIIAAQLLPEPHFGERTFVV
jgi:hypothetical protein